MDGKESHKLYPGSDENDTYSFLGPTPAGAETIIIGDGIKEIGAYAFSSFLVHPKISNLIIASSVETIGNGAFKSNNLTSVTIPKSVEYIGTGTFSSNRLASVSFENGSKLKYIGKRGFSGNQLTDITIPSTTETIGEYAFSDNKLTTVKFEENSKLKTIDYHAFSNNQLTNSGLGKLPSSLTKLATSAFSDNSSLTQITLTSPTDLEGWTNGGTVDGKTVTYER